MLIFWLDMAWIEAQFWNFYGYCQANKIWTFLGFGPTVPCNLTVPLTFTKPFFFSLSYTINGKCYLQVLLVHKKIKTLLEKTSSLGRYFVKFMNETDIHEYQILDTKMGWNGITRVLHFISWFQMTTGFQHLWKSK